MYHVYICVVHCIYNTGTVEKEKDSESEREREDEIGRHTAQK